MEQIEAQLQPGQLPAGFCGKGMSWQQIYNLFFQLGRAVFPLGFNGVIISDSEPSSEDRGKMWVKTSLGYPIRWFRYAGGFWIWPHEIPASDDRVFMWRGAAIDVTGIDLPANNSDPITPTTGPFWEIDTDFQARMPIGPGMLGSATINVGDVGGANQVTLAGTNLPQHQHGVPIEGTGNPKDNLTGTFRTASTNIDYQSTPVANALGLTRMGGGQETPDPFSIMNPYIGVYFIRRTARVYYTP